MMPAVTQAQAQALTTSLEQQQQQQQQQPQQLPQSLVAGKQHQPLQPIKVAKDKLWNFLSWKQVFKIL